MREDSQDSKEIKAFTTEKAAEIRGQTHDHSKQSIFISYLFNHIHIYIYIYIYTYIIYIYNMYIYICI
jgi:hypothetical protein